MMQNVTTYHAVSWSRSRSTCGRIMRGAASEAEAVSGATHCVNQFRLEAVVDLPAKSADENLEDIGEWIVILVPHMRSDRRSVDDDVLVGGEKLEQREFLRCEIDRLPVARRTFSRQVDLEIRDRDLLRDERRGP